MANTEDAGPRTRYSRSPVVDRETINEEVECELQMAMVNFDECEKIDDSALKSIVQDETVRKKLLTMITKNREDLRRTTKSTLRDKIFDKAVFQKKYGIIRDEKAALKKDVDIEREKYVQAYSLLSVRLYLEQLKREFREGSKAPEKEQMIQDLERAGETVAFTRVSVHYIEWLWFLKLSNYGPAKDLHRLVKKHFAASGDFVELLSHLWGEASDQIHHPLGTLTPDEIKRGLGFYGLASKRMDLAIDILFQLKKRSPRMKRCSSVVPEHKQIKRVKLDRSKFLSETDSSSPSES